MNKERFIIIGGGSFELVFACIMQVTITQNVISEEVGKSEFDQSVQLPLVFSF